MKPKITNQVNDETSTQKDKIVKSQIAVRLPRSLFNKLKRYVEETGVSQTEIVVSALAHHLDSLENVPMTQRLLELEKRVSVLEGKN